MNISSFYVDLKARVIATLATYRVFAENKMDADWLKTVILNITDIQRSPDTNVYRVECEFIISDAVYTSLAADAKTLQNAIHGYRGLFPSVGGDTRAYVNESIHGVKLTAQGKDEGKLVDMPHLRFCAVFFIETS